MACAEVKFRETILRPYRACRPIVSERKAAARKELSDEIAAAIWKMFGVTDDHLGQFFECAIGELQW